MFAPARAHVRLATALLLALGALDTPSRSRNMSGPPIDPPHPRPAR